MVIKNFLRGAALLILTLILPACSDNDEVRMPDDIVGIWSPSDTRYLDFQENYSLFNLEIFSREGERYGQMTQDGYLYEPGYQIVIYLNGTGADVYQVVKLTSSELTWCWVDEISTENADRENIGKILGDIIKKAQEGFKLDPELYQSFRKISQEEYLEVIESLDYIW